MIDLLPVGTVADVTGAGATAEVLREHLGALGATVTGPGPVSSSGIAATATLRLPDGRRRAVIVDWAIPAAAAEVSNETAVQAICGIMHVNGRRFGEPRALAVDYCSTAAGVLAATGLLASLLVPDSDLRLRTSVAEAALLSVSQYLAAAGADDPEAVDLAPGGPPFTSSDGVRFEIEALQPEPWAQFWTTLRADPPAWRKGWRPFQFRYATATAPLPEALHRATLELEFRDIEAAAARAGVSICRLHGLREPSTPAIDSLLTPWTVSSVPGELIDRGSNAIAAAPLTGTVVLEAGRRVQGPLAAHLLRLLGARVTRIEPPGGDPLREMPPCNGDLSSRWLALNRGKSATEIDIKSPRDRELLRQMSTKADVFLHNWAPGNAERLQLSAADLAPGIVYTYTSGWAGISLPGLPTGTDFMVQARTGLAELVGRAQAPAAPSLMTLLDVLGGILGAEATVIGLLRRHATQQGVAVESSLLAAANTLRKHGRPSGAEPVQRQPFRRDRDWVAVTESDEHAVVTTDIGLLLSDRRFTAVIGRDEYGCPALCTPWRLS
jgi:crotonobetainyl-CoA:carnitine CoA-transferase CaiB-like acyl-CoA transferase